MGISRVQTGPLAILEQLLVWEMSTKTDGVNNKRGGCPQNRREMLFAEIFRASQINIPKIRIMYTCLAFAFSHVLHYLTTVLTRFPRLLYSITLLNHSFIWVALDQLSEKKHQIYSQSNYLIWSNRPSKNDFDHHQKFLLMMIVRSKSR